MNTDLKTAVAAAESLLQQWAQIQTARSAAETSIEPSIRARLQAEADLGEIEADAALSDKPDTKKVEAARKTLTNAREAVDGSIARKAGLAKRAEQQAAALQAAQATLLQSIPAHIEAVAVSFRPEWDAAVQAFSAILGKRARLETLLKTRFVDFPEPNPVIPAGAMNDEAGRPGGVLNDLEAALAWIGGQRQAVQRSEKRRGNFDADGTYLVRRAVAGHPTGSLVIGSMLGAEGPHLFANGYLKRIAADGAIGQDELPALGAALRSA